ncbi:MAG: 1,4-beta-xylanase, partial [Kiritimatiellae bacterium]|nr:1,4-beta-xylanase [Kiritimatiellia bacterium]
MTTKMIAGIISMAAAVVGASGEVTGRWSVEQARSWHESTGWLVGCNFSPSTAINQLEMWQADSFDRETIERELDWAASLGFNSVRVYLHSLAWRNDPEGFLRRTDAFLDMAESRKIGVMLVLFDSCWHPFPKAG